MKINRRSLATLLLLLSGPLVITLWLWWMGLHNGGVQFLSHRKPAEWIVYPSPPNARARSWIELDTKFHRDFHLPAGPSTATLSLCAFKRCSVMLNDVPAPLPNAPSGNWKAPLSVEVGKLLRPGQNRIDVTVYNESGPPALWLTLQGEGFVMPSDATWEASYAGAVWSRARLAEEPAKIMAGSPIYGGERVWPSLCARWPELLLLGLLSAGLLAGASRWFRSIKASGPTVGSGLFTDPAIACLVGIGLLWILLFVHNAALLPRVMGFDARPHLDYIKYIQERWRLPLAYEGASMYNPPLYYLAAAGVLGACNLTTGDYAGIVLLRCLMLAIGITHLLLVFGSLRLIFPGRSAKQVVGLLLAAFLPAQLYLCHYVTNEVLLSVLVTATLYCCLRALRDERLSTARFASLGAVLGLALLTKFTAVLVVPFVLGAIAMRLFQTGTRDWRTWFRTAGLTALTCLIVCGWHYTRVWMHYGKPLVGGWESVSGLHWWQDPGYRTGAYFLHFGESLINPLFSGQAGFADGIYSTLWGDGYCGGTSALEYRPPWDYELMAAGYLLALLPTVLILAGACISLGKFIGKPRAEGLLMNGLAWSFVAAFVYMAVKVPYYSQIKAFYGLLILLPVCVFAAEGWDFFAQRRRGLRLAMSMVLGMWALTSLSTYWVSGKSASTQFLLGQELAREGQDEKAVHRLSAALQANPSHFTAKSWLANSLNDLGQQEAANRLFDQLRDQEPKSGVGQLEVALVFENLASALEKKGRLAEAVEHTRRVIELAPEAAIGYRRLAARLMKLGQPEQAVAACRRGLRIAPVHPELHLLLGMALMQQTTAGEAASEPEGPSPAMDGTSAFVRPEFVGESIRHLRLAIQLAPNDVETLNKLAWVYATSPDKRWRRGAEAVQLAERACQLTDSRSPELVGTLAVAYAEDGRFPEAIAAARKAQMLAQPLGQSQLVELNEERIGLFRAGQPYRQPLEFFGAKPNPKHPMAPSNL